MKRIILCEGRTDAILISYFLEKKFGWTYAKPSKHYLVPFNIEDENEEFNRYWQHNKKNPELAIWGVGGLNKMPHKLNEVIKRNKSETKQNELFGKIVLFFDQDDTPNKTESIVLDWLKNSQLELIDDLKLGDWGKVTMKIPTNLSRSQEIEILPIALPPNNQGTLETFLLDALRNESEVNENLVKSAKAFINKQPREPYLKRRRAPDKACLGATLSVMSPEWVFTETNKRLKSVPWETIQDILSIYGQLEYL